jgi:malate dehydrogenase (oxaloacetate-decarboxylating)(NADP+)
MMMILTEKKPLFFADTSINKNPSTEDLVEIARMAEFTVKSFAIEPRLRC